MTNEDREQIALINWANSQPWGQLLFHITNENVAGAKRGSRNKAMGVRAGVPDMFLPIPANGYHGLWIELKAAGGSTSLEQDIWIRNLTNLGYRAEVAFGHVAAQEIIEDYLEES